VRELYAKEGRHAVPYTVAAEHWDYKPESSSAIQTAAAIKAYGLVNVNGSGNDRRMSLSQRGLDIVLDEQEESESRDAAIKAAALAPAIHAELWKKYGPNLPSDAALRTFLLRERGFNPTALDPFIAEYKSTISFAKLEPGDTIPEETDEESPDSEQDQDKRRKPPPFKPPQMPPNSVQDVFNLNEGAVVLQIPARLSIESVEDMEDWLKVAIRRLKRAATNRESDETKLGETP